MEYLIGCDIFVDWQPVRVSGCTQFDPFNLPVELPPQHPPDGMHSVRNYDPDVV